MPIFKTINTIFSNGASVNVLIWKITESFDDLLSTTNLEAKSAIRLSSMKSEMHQCGFLSIRQLLAQIGLSDADLFYDESGKPFLKNGQHISITHSFEFSAIAISEQNIGIDIEQQRTKIIAIANKFCLSEYAFLNETDDNFISKLTTIWGAKESVFKIENQKGISFKNNISVTNFKKIDQKVIARLNFEARISTFEMTFMTIENYMLVYGLKISEQ